MSSKSSSLQNISYFAPGMVIAYGHSIDAQPHQHRLWQICLPSQASLLNNQPLLAGAVIKPGESHQLSMPNGWVILAEPECLLGEAISEISTPLPMRRLIPWCSNSLSFPSWRRPLKPIPTNVAINVCSSYSPGWIIASLGNA